MLACDYRTVPATVDVVNVKKYDLIQPHSAPYVFALGMTQSHFPKVGQNKSLLSDEERSRINEATDEHRRLDIVTQSNSKRGHFVAMSLFNAASEQLVLSQPQIINESQDDMSVYLKELDLGIPLVEKGRNRFEAKGTRLGTIETFCRLSLPLTVVIWILTWTKKPRLSGRLLYAISVSDLIRIKS